MGVRSVYIDVFNSTLNEDAYPIVTTGIKKGEWKLGLNSLNFEDVCVTIASIVFSNGYVNNFMIAETGGNAGMSIQSYNSASSYTTIALGDRTTHNRGYIEQRCGDNNQMTIGLNGNGSFRFIGKNSGGSTAERIRITYDGITFNGDTAAANALDDYEEGTWTPVPILTYNPGGRSITAGTSEGIYVKMRTISKFNKMSTVFLSTRIELGASK